MTLSLSIKRVLFAIVLRKRDRKNGQTHESRSFGKNVEPKQIEIRSVNGRVVENRVEVISGKS